MPTNPTNNGPIITPLADPAQGSEHDVGVDPSRLMEVGGGKVMDVVTPKAAEEDGTPASE